MYNIIQVYRFSDISSFVLKWSATVFLLYHYSRKIGKAIYWVLVSIPLIYFLGTFMEDFHLYGPHSDSEFFYWYLYGALNSTAGGILFGTGFMLGARHFPEKSSIKDYMMISAFGFILFFSAGQSTLAVTPYPPYGFATMSFFCIIYLFDIARFVLFSNLSIRRCRAKETHKKICSTRSQIHGGYRYCTHGKGIYQKNDCKSKRRTRGAYRRVRRSEAFNKRVGHHKYYKGGRKRCSKPKRTSYKLRWRIIAQQKARNEF